MTWLFCAILAALCWGVGQVLLKKGYEVFSVPFIYLVDSIFQLIIYIPFVLIKGLSFESWPTILLLSLATVVGNWFYYYSISKGELALTGTVMAAYPSVVIVLSFLFLGERLNSVQWLAIVAVIVGCICIALPKKKSKFTFETWLAWALGAVFVIGAADFLGKIAVNKGGPYQFMFFLSIFQLMAANIYYFSQKKKERSLPKTTTQIWITSTSGIFLLVSGLLFFYLGLSKGPASLVSPISGAYVVVTVILGLTFLKEKINRNQLIGIILVIVGVILTSI